MTTELFKSCGDRRRLEAHLCGCPHCRAYLEHIRTAIRLTGAMEPQDLTPEARADLIRALPALAVRIARRDPISHFEVGPSAYSDREGEVLCDAAGKVEVANEADRVET